MPLIAFADCGLDAVHRDDVAGGILLALDRGRAGEAYVLGGELTTLGAMAATVARLTGHRAPRSLPSSLLRVLPVSRRASATSSPLGRRDLLGSECWV